jgi:hypothetical protein
MNRLIRVKHSQANLANIVLLRNEHYFYRIFCTYYLQIYFTHQEIIIHLNPRLHCQERCVLLSNTYLLLLQA